MTERAALDGGRNVARWAGAFGLGAMLVFFLALPLYFIGPQPAARLEETLAFSESVAAARSTLLLRTAIADPLIMAGLLVFLAGFRHLIRQAKPELEWVATLVFTAGAVLIALELVGDGFQAAAALDASAKAEPAATRALYEASFPFYGAIGLAMSALFLSSAGYATLASAVLPKWTGRVAYAAAAINLVAAPSIFGGMNYTEFYSASGYITFIAQAAMFVWFLVATLATFIRRRP